MFGMSKKQTRTVCWVVAVVLAAMEPAMGLGIGLFFGIMELAGH